MKISIECTQEEKKEFIDRVGPSWDCYVCEMMGDDNCVDRSCGESIEKMIEWKILERWRAGIHKEYYFINSDFGVSSTCETGFPMDNARYDIKNYFRTEEEAKIAADQMKALLLGI